MDVVGDEAGDGRDGHCGRARGLSEADQTSRNGDEKGKSPESTAAHGSASSDGWKRTARRARPQECRHESSPDSDESRLMESSAAQPLPVILALPRMSLVPGPRGPSEKARSRS